MIGRNNPFNIRFYSVNNWLGQTVPHKGFCQFVTFDLGLRAGFCLLKTYLYHGYDNVVSIVSHFAPPNENDTKKYIRYVQSQFDAYGLSERNIKFDSNAFFVLAKSILWYESNFTLTVDRYNRIMNNFLR